MSLVIKKLRIALFVGFISLTFTLLGKFALGVDSSPTPSATPPPYEACVDHGGVNCSVLRPDASVVCNDGTINASFTIYAVSQCQESIQVKFNREFKQIGDTMCYPPSEMGCSREQSYQDLKKIHSASGLVNSELSKDELAICRKQIQNYQLRNNDYNKCLVENNLSQFELAGPKLIRPVLKVVFCPIFFGDNSSYDENGDLCVCDKGYFLSETPDFYGSQCLDASLICKSKYGQNSYAKNGSCIAPRTSLPIYNTPPITPVTTKRAPLPSISTVIGPYPTTTKSYALTPLPILSETISVPAPAHPKTEPNLFKLIYNLLASGVKK